MKKIFIPAIMFAISSISVCLGFSRTKTLLLASPEISDYKTITFGTTDNPFPCGNGSGFCYSDDKTATIEQIYAADSYSYTAGGSGLSLTNNGVDNDIATFNWVIYVHGVVTIDYYSIKEGDAGTCEFSGYDTNGKAASYTNDFIKKGEMNYETEGTIRFANPFDVCEIRIHLGCLIYAGMSISSLKITYSTNVCQEILK